VPAASPLSLGQEMKSKLPILLLLLGAYEIFFGFRTLWNVVQGRFNNIMIADHLIRGMPASSIFLLIGLSGFVFGYGTFLLKRWAFFGLFLVNSILILVYISNLIFVGMDDLLKLGEPLPQDPLLRFKFGILQRLTIAFGLNLLLWLYRKRFINGKGAN
jgi:hypothetical protein